MEKIMETITFAVKDVSNIWSHRNANFRLNTIANNRVCF